MKEMKDMAYVPPDGADMPDDDCITIVTDDVPLGKRIHADGTKSSNVMLVDGEAYTVRCRTHEELAEVIRYASERNTCALILGHFGVPLGTEFRLVSRGLMRAMIATVRGLPHPEDVHEEEADGIHMMTDQAGVSHIAVCRTKANAQPSRWALIDRDIDAQTPAEFATLDHAGFIQRLEAVLPGVSRTTRITTLSSSARVTEFGGKPGSKAGHTFVRLSHAVDRDWLKACVRAKAIATGNAWLVNKYSRTEPGQVVAQDWRCLLDDSVLALERLVFCGAPTIDQGAGLVVHPQAVEVVQGELAELPCELGAMELPEAEQLESVSRAAGRLVQVEVSNFAGTGGIAQFRQGGLTMDTPIETRGGVMPLRQVAASLAVGTKVRCQAPFRESVSWAAFVGLTQKGEPFVYDSGTNTTYNLERESDPAISAMLQAICRRNAEASGVKLPDPTPAPTETLPLVDRPDWFNAIRQAAPSVLPQEARAKIEENEHKVEAKVPALGDAGKLPKAVLEGMSRRMREAYEWMLATQPTEPQSELALAATISLLATVLGRKVRTQTGIRTNMYVVAVAATGTGKEHGRKCVRKALAAGGLAHLEGGDPASGPALVSRMAESPSTLLQLDEFGLLMQQAKKENSPRHGIIKELLALTGSAEQSYVGTMYSDTRAKAAKAIHYPCLTVYATTTAETLYDALSGSDMASGFVNRLMIIESPAQARASLGLRYQDKGQDVPQALVEWMAAVHSAGKVEGSNLNGLTAEMAPTVSYSAPAMHIAETTIQPWLEGAMEVAKTKGMTDLWTRFGALLQRLALVHACSDYDAADYIATRDGLGLEIGPGSISWAFALAKHTMLRAEAVLGASLAGSDHEALMNKIIEFVRKPYGLKRKGLTLGGPLGATKALLLGNTRFARAAKPLDLNNAMAALIEAGEMVEVDVDIQGQGRHRVFVATEHYAVAMADDGFSQHVAGHPDACYITITESIITQSRARG